MTAATSSPSGVDLQQLVQEADIGGRKPMGFVRTLMFAVCIGWSVLQLWYASPLPFALRIFVLNDTEMRALHLALALFLALCKRRHELVVVADAGGETRPGQGNRPWSICSSRSREWSC